MYEFVINKLDFPNRLRNFVAVGIANFSVLVLSLIATILLARLMRIEDYGRVLYFIGWVGSLRVLMALGLGTKISKDVAEGAQQEDFRTRYWSLLTLRLFTILLAGIIVIFIGQWFSIDYLVLAWLAASLAVSSDFMLATLGGLQLVKGINYVLISQPLIYLLVVLFWVIIFPNNLLLGAIWGYILSFISSIGIGIFYLLRYKKISLRISSISPPYIRQSLRFIGLVYLLALLRSFYRTIMTLLLGAQASYDLVSLIGVPINLIFFPATMINVAIITVVYPEFCKHSGSGRFHEFTEILNSYTRYIAIAVLLYLTILVSFPEEIIGIVYSSKYVASYRIIYFLAPTALLDLLSTLLMFALIARSRTRDALAANLIQFVTLFTGIFILSKMPLGMGKYEMWIGLCYTFSALLGFCWMWFKLERTVHFQVRIQNIFLSTWFFVFIYLLFIFSKAVFKTRNTLFLPVSIIMGTLFVGIFLFSSGFLNGKYPWFVSPHDPS